MGIPETTFIRRKAIFEWLGITRDDLDKLVENKLIHPVILPGKKYRNYITKEILRVFTKGIKHECAKQSWRTPAGQSGTTKG